MSNRPDVAIVGLGYVGLTLAVTMAEAGMRVWGYEREQSVVQRLKGGHSHIFEPALEEGLQNHIGRNLVVDDRMPEAAPKAIVICVSTPAGEDKKPDLRNLKAATETVVEAIAEDTLVIVRSTVPIGTTRSIVLPVLKTKQEIPLLASCPERTMQGNALHELRSLPQVVGPLNEESRLLAVALWGRMTDKVSEVESLEAAEMVKLVNNCHTDMLYAFGNEVAMIASQHGLDPLQVIKAANVDYPRPDIARPGFVAGPCLTKDPYLLIDSIADDSYVPHLVTGARHTNEQLPVDAANHFVKSLGFLNGDMQGAKVVVCGFAYKGWPITDDVRGSSTSVIMERLKQAPLDVYGHDYLVPDEIISSMGATPVHNIDDVFDEARAVLFVNEHPEYRRLNIASAIESMKKPALIYDAWRMFDADLIRSIPGISYAGIGYG